MKDRTLYQALFEEAEDAIFIHDLEGRFLAVNRAAREQLGYDRETLLAMRVTDLDAPISAELVPGRIANLKERGEMRVETLHVTATGETLPVAIHARLIDYEGQEAVLSITRDISEPRFSQQFFQEALDALAAHIAILDGDGIIRLVNRPWKRFAEENGLGWKGYGVGRSYLAACDQAAEGGDAIATEVARRLRQILAGKESAFSLEYPCHSPVAERWFILRVSHFTLGGELQVVVSHSNITERRQAEIALQEYQRRLEAQNLELRKLSLAIEQSGSAVVITDTEGLIQYVNPRFEELTGYTSGEVLGQNPRVLKSGTHRADYYRVLWETISNGQIWRGEFHNRRKEGALYWESAVIAPVHDVEGRIIHYIAIKEDISSRKQAEETLRVVAESDMASGEDVFRLLVRQLARSQGKRYALIARVDEEDPTVAHTLAVWAAGDFADNFSYELRGAPCQQVIREGVCFYPRAVQQHFPEDLLLAEMGVESYWGLPLYASTGEKLGLIALLDDRPMEENFQTSSLLRSLAARAAAEMERRSAEERFRLLFETMVQGVVYQDGEGHIISANAAAERILGLTFDQMQGRTSIDPRWRAIREDGSDFPGDVHPAMVALRTGEEVRDVVMGIFNPYLEAYRWILVHAVPLFRPGESRPYQVYTTFEDLTERKEAERAAEWESRVRAAMADLSQALLTTATLDEIGELVLEWSKWLTDSEFGYVGYIDPESGSLVSSTMTREIWDVCEVPEKDVVFHEFKGLWGWVLDNRRALFTNDPVGDPRSGGIPEGHLPIRRFLSAPAMIGERLVGQIALANAGREYTTDDLGLVERLAALYALAVQKQRAETTLRKYAEEQAALYAVSSAISALQTPETLLTNVLELVLNLLGAAGGWVSVPEDGKPQLIANQNVAGMELAMEEAVEVASCPAYACREEGDVTPVEQCPHFERTLIAGEEHVRLCVPLVATGEVLGVLTLIWLPPAVPTFEPSLLRALGQQVGIALRNAQLYQQARQLDRLRALNSLDKELSASLDPATLTRVILRQLSRNLPVAASLLVLCDREAELCGEQSLRLSEGRIEPLRFSTSPPDLQALLTYLREGRRVAPFLLSEIRAVRDLALPGLERGDALVAPVWNSQGLIGLLALGRAPGQEPFRDEDQALVQAVAHRAGQVLRNAQLYQASREQTHRLIHLNAISAVAVSSLDPDTVLREILALSAEALHATEGSILLREGERELVFAFTLGSKARRLSGVKLPAGAGIAGWALQHNKAVVVPDVAQDGRFYGEVDARTGFTTRSLLCAPLRYQGEVLGVIEMVSERVGQFDGADLHHLEAVASIAAVALQNARLFTETRLRAEELERLNAFGLTLTSTLDFQEVTDFALDQVRRLYRADATSLFQLDAETGDLVCLGLMLPSGSVRDALHIPPGTGVAGEVVTHRRPILLEDAEQDDRFWHGITDLLGLIPRSYMAVPLLIHDRLVGVLSVLRSDPGHYSREDLQTLQAFATPLVVALENARLYADLKALFEEREQAQAQLLQMEKMAALGRLGASIAHEINNPLQAIQGCLTLADEEIAEQGLFVAPERVQEYLHIADTEIDRISDIVRRMRDFYRPARRGIEPTRLPALLEGVLALTRKQLEHARVRVEREVAADLPLIEANPDHLKQVILNLVLNAVDAMPSGGALRLRAALDTLHIEEAQVAAVRLEFEDTGVGMDEETLVRLYEPFFTTKSDGSGLGLSISYSIIRAHHGEIHVTSAPGEGTRFTLLLPVAQSGLP